MPKKELRQKLYYSIAEVSDYFELAPSLLRYWETQFESIKPKRNNKGTRFYTSKDIEAIKTIHHIVKVQGHTLAGAKEKLKKSKKSVDKRVKTIEKLKEIRSFLEDLGENI